ncbi:MAG TPA: redoxin domain-containing protein [Steroidobacteraceae bacterium]|nr:redoxin domain-containing protein [Steroidobacteraceae bacterium]
MSISLDALKGFARAALLASLFGGTPAGSVHATELSRVTVGARAPLFTAKGADGKQHSLRDYAGKLVVLEWTNPVCPFTAVKYKSGAMQALQRYAASRQIVWLSIDTAAPDKAGYLTPAAARARIAQTQATVTGFLFDVNGNIARSYGAKTTPSFFVVNRDGKLAYEGAMDDQVFADDRAGREYVKSALDDLIAGRPVQKSETQPQGCAIEY